MIIMDPLNTGDLEDEMRYNDMSPHPDRWTNAKLIREARAYANLEQFSVGYNEIPANYPEGWHDQVSPDEPRIDEFVRRQTRIFRESWLNPILDEIERRFVKVK